METRASGRMLLFEVAGARYALPIEAVREVAELSCVRCVPGLPRAVAGVANWHGDALPVVSASQIFCSDAGAEPASEPALPDSSALQPGAEAERSTEHVLVLSDGEADRAQLGLPVDRVLGLIDAVVPRGPSGELVAARQPVDGRVVNVLDPCAFWARAETVIAEAAA